MTILKYILWFISLCFWCIVTFFLRKKEIKLDNNLIRIFLIILKSIITIVLAYGIAAVSIPIVWKFEYLFGTLYIVLIADVFFDIINMIMLLFCKNTFSFKFIEIIRLSITLFVFLYGTLNSQIIIPNHINYTSEKIKNEIKFVFLSDVHYGAAQTKITVENAFLKIKNINPDFIVLGGDITDENTTKEQMEEIYSIIGSTGIKTYFVYGNHDRQPEADYVGGKKYSNEELESIIKNNEIEILKDDYIYVNENIILLGREDITVLERLKVEDLKQRSNDAYVICIDHSPYQETDIKKTKADLQLSGHTHAGQLFPLKTVYKLGVNNIFGKYKMDNTDIYVSSGFSGWGMPLRTEEHCNFEVVTLKKSEFATDDKLSK